jgi:hypothetical protein
LGKLPWAAQVYIAVVILLAILLAATGPSTGADWTTVAVLALLLFVVESAATMLRTPHQAWSANSAAILAAVILTGPVGAAIVGGCSLFEARRLPGIAQRFFNAGMLALAGYLPGRVYLLLGGHVGTPDTTAFPKLIWVFGVVAITHIVVNYSLLAGVLHLTRSPSAPAERNHLFIDVRLIVTELGYCAFGLLIAALWGELYAATPVLVLVPLLVAHWAVAQFAAQQRAYDATVSALCQAVETKDFYTRGHSERVSRGSVLIAREIGMHRERVEAIRYAGMLHDVGKLGVPTRVLQKTGKLTEEEYAAIQLHPMRGLDIVREIGFLDEAMAGIMHHHERIDGRGYPMGLAGDEIPEFARVISVADAFDSMTSTRSYRGARSVQEAIAELRRWSGTQFDPAFVDAFVAAVRRDGWQQPDTPAPEPDELVEVAAQDHDDPTAPIRVTDGY